MRIILDTNALNAALSTVTKALPVRTTISVLEGIYMKADRKRLLLRCTDLNIQIETYVDAMIEKEGAAVLPGRLFSEMAKRLPGDTVSIDVKKNTAEIISGSYRTTLQCEDANEYHAMNDIEGGEYNKNCPGRFQKHGARLHIRSGAGRFKAHTYRRAYGDEQRFIKAYRA